MTWANKQVAIDGWHLLFMSLNAPDADTPIAQGATAYINEGLDSLQKVFWGDYGYTGEFPEGAAANLSALTKPLIAIRATFAPFIHTQEQTEWALWSARLDEVIKISESPDFTPDERLMLVAAACLHGIAPIGDADGLPLVTLPFLLVRASRQWHDAEKWWHDIVEALAELDGMNILGLDRLGELLPKAASAVFWIVGGAALTSLLLFAIANSK